MESDTCRPNPNFEKENSQNLPILYVVKTLTEDLFRQAYIAANSHLFEETVLSNEILHNEKRKQVFEAVGEVIDELFWQATASASATAMTAESSFASKCIMLSEDEINAGEAETGSARVKDVTETELEIGPSEKKLDTSQAFYTYMDTCHACENTSSEMPTSKSVSFKKKDTILQRENNGQHGNHQVGETTKVEDGNIVQHINYYNLKNHNGSNQIFSEEDDALPLEFIHIQENCLPVLGISCDEKKTDYSSYLVGSSLEGPPCKVPKLDYNQLGFSEVERGMTESAIPSKHSENLPTSDKIFDRYSSKSESLSLSVGTSMKQLRSQNSKDFVEEEMGMDCDAFYRVMPDGGNMRQKSNSDEECQLETPAERLLTTLEDEPPLLDPASCNEESVTGNIHPISLVGEVKEEPLKQPVIQDAIYSHNEDREQKCHDPQEQKVNRASLTEDYQSFVGKDNDCDDVDDHVEPKRIQGAFIVNVGEKREASLEGQEVKDEGQQKSCSLQEVMQAIPDQIVPGLQEVGANYIHGNDQDGLYAVDKAIPAEVAGPSKPFLNAVEVKDEHLSDDTPQVLISSNIANGIQQVPRTPSSMFQWRQTIYNYSSQQPSQHEQLVSRFNEQTVPEVVWRPPPLPLCNRRRRIGLSRRQRVTPLHGVSHPPCQQMQTLGYPAQKQPEE